MQRWFSVCLAVVAGSVCLTAGHLLLPRLDCPPSLVGITASLLAVLSDIALPRGVLVGAPSVLLLALSLLA